jgi:hypothetical protein
MIGTFVPLFAIGFTMFGLNDHICAKLGLYEPADDFTKVDSKVDMVDIE